MREKGQTEVAKTLETPVFSRGIEILTEKLIFCKHRERDTYEVPGGHRESGEDILSIAKRELMEETGAIDFTIKLILSREKQE